MRRTFLTLCTALIVAGNVAAQQATAPAAPPPAKPEDVASADAILKALYDVISGPAGQKRDWDRMRSIFAPGARLIPTGKRQDGSVGHQVWSVDDYIRTNAGPLESGGFFEREIGRTVEQFGNVTQVFSTYEARRTANMSETPFMRGINSIQLLNDGKRWWVMTVFWDSERPDNPIPAKYIQVK